MTSSARKKHVEDWQAGGLSIAAFCRSRNLKYHTFRLWIKKYAESDPASETSGQTTSMVRLNLPMVVGPPPTDTSRGIGQLVFKLRQRIDYQESIIGTLHDEIALLKKRIFA